jgi:phenylacetate-CoA ligase
MGGNMSGALFAYALRAIGIETGRTTLLTPGRDEETCIEEIAEFSPHFSQTILYSYPSFAKNILEKAAGRGIPVANYGIRLRLLGEGYSETYRDHLNALLHHPQGALDTINSGYGATDFRGAGKESLLCIAIKRLLHEQDLTKELFGLDNIPTICQYNPDFIYIEGINGELVMTRHNAVPLVRYRSGDTGFVMGYEEMIQLLAGRGLDPFKLMEERGCDPARATRQPFVMMTGRKDGGIIFLGAKIQVAKVKSVLEETPYLAERLTGEFQLRKGEDNDLTQYLELSIVARPDAGEPDPAEIAGAFADALGARQGGIYADVLGKDRGAALPRIRFVEREEIMTPASFKIRYLG